MLRNDDSAVPLSRQTPELIEGGSGLRQLMESLICLAIAVVLLRTFEVEGYMISTGSMAPSLLGYHKRVVCPTCRYPFAFGVDYEQERTRMARSARGQGRQSRRTAGPYRARTIVTCPNCNQNSIDISDVPLNQGDQLLVHKHSYQFHTPRRWDIVVFQNPDKSSQAYVKRILGLPGEAVQIIRGDVYADGRIQRKDLTAQREVRIPVYDHAYRPQNDPDWQDRWVRLPGTARWKPHGDGFVFNEGASPRASAGQFTGWLAYRHWIRAGGGHHTSVGLRKWPDDISPPDALLLPVRYDEETRQLSCTGVLSSCWRDRLLGLSNDPHFARAVKQLAERSHIAPITDDYGYNRSPGPAMQTAVRDLVLAADVSIRGGQGELIWQMTDGRHVFDCIFDLAAQKVHLIVDGADTPVRSAPLPPAMREGTVLVEMSLMDRQVLVAVDGQTIFEPWTYAESSRRELAPREPIRLGARNLAVHISGLKLFRDIYYTPGRGIHGIEQPYQLGDEEYFVLGDNSPISRDSRSWPTPEVHRRLFLGKPIFLHLPSRQEKIRIGNYHAYIRIPDLSRIRYIR